MIKIGGIYRYNGRFLGTEEDRYYKVLEDEGTHLMCLHLNGGGKCPILKSYWYEGKMDLDGSYKDDTVLQRIKHLHERQAPKHKFFSKEYTT